MIELHESNFRKKHKNDLWDILNNQAPDFEDPLPLPVSEFEWHGPQKTAKGWVASVRHVPSGSEFRIAWSGQFSPDEILLVDYSPHTKQPSLLSNVRGWTAVLGNFSIWLRALAEESIPDYWENYRIQSVLSAGFASDYDSEFTGPELDQIGESFRVATSEIYERGLLGIDDLASLGDVFKEQHKAAETTPRIQWQTIAATAIITRLLERGVDTVTIQSVLSVLGTAFAWLNPHLGATLQQTVLLLSGRS